jgi:acetate---CoA ligase (ADP-forming)
VFLVAAFKLCNYFLVYTKTAVVVYFSHQLRMQGFFMPVLQRTPESYHAAQRLMAPQSVVIIGASADPRSFGGFVLGNLERFGYGGKIHLVSRSATKINGHDCVASIDDLPEGIDVAVFAIPESGVVDAIIQCGQRKVGTGIVYASGYGEAGVEGRAKQDALLAAAESASMALLGPNCMGMTNYQLGVPLTFEPIEPIKPIANTTQVGIGVLAQSGAMAANMRDAFIGRGLQVTASISTGNEVSLGIEDFIAAYLEDINTKVLALYVEQVRRPAEFLALCERARTLGKPVVLMMPGRSAKAKAAAQSHTGALAGDHAVACAALRRQAVVIVDSFDELFDVCAVLLRFPSPPAQGVAVLTGSGALKNVALDLAESVPVTLPALGKATVAQLESMLPSYAVAENPLDYTTIGVRDPGLIGKVMHTVLADENIGSLMLCIMAGPEVAQRDKTEHILPAFASATKPCALVVLGDNLPLIDFFSSAIAQSGIPFFRSADRAMRALGRVGEYGRLLERAVDADLGITPLSTASRSDFPKSTGTWSEYASKAWLKSFGLTIPSGQLTRTVEEAVRLATVIGYPLVMKAQSAALPHKTEAGAVMLNVQNEIELRLKWTQLFENLQRRRPDLLLGSSLEGVLVEAMTSKGLELIVGAKRDKDWGPMLLVGLGGVWIEALADVRLIAPDLQKAEIINELMQLKGASLLKGIRGASPVAIEAIAETVMLLGRQIMDYPAIEEIEVNPLLASQHHDRPNGVMALDALIVTKA